MFYYLRFIMMFDKRKTLLGITLVVTWFLGLESMATDTIKIGENVSQVPVGVLCTQLVDKFVTLNPALIKTDMSSTKTLDPLPFQVSISKRSYQNGEYVWLAAWSKDYTLLDSEVLVNEKGLVEELHKTGLVKFHTPGSYRIKLTNPNNPQLEFVKNYDIWQYQCQYNYTNEELQKAKQIESIFNQVIKELKEQHPSLWAHQLWNKTSEEIKAQLAATTNQEHTGPYISGYSDLKSLIASINDWISLSLSI